MIEINKVDNYNKANLKADQRLICKLMYLSYGIWSNIVFAIKQLSKQNFDLRIGYLKVAK